MLPIRDNQTKGQVPIVTWTIIALNVMIYIWDRRLHLFLPNGILFADLAMRPREVVAVFQGQGDRFALVTVLTSMFLHGSIAHILGNMLFLSVFGPAVEEAVGSGRYCLYYLVWGLAAAFAQILIDPGSLVPTLGASGAIGGVLGAYFLLFPTNKVEVVLPVLAFLSFEVAAWVLLGVWFLYQVFIPQEGVATWAHVGGFTAGMLTVLFLGGRQRILKGRDPERDFGYL
ncbi:MAG: rhomboid family intramembrane serine protease [Armatimonadetes bacterium]|nr:rhomboid family intramembrane serine protease [Armatimonadota bacterium]